MATIDSQIVTLEFDYSDMERLIDMYVSEQSEMYGKMYGSYRCMARDQMDDFLMWLRNRLEKNDDIGNLKIIVTLMLVAPLLSARDDDE